MKFVVEAKWAQNAAVYLLGTCGYDQLFLELDGFTALNSFDAAKFKILIGCS